MKYFIYIFDWTKIKCILFSDYFLIFLNYKYKLFVFFCLFICYFFFCLVSIFFQFHIIKKLFKKKQNQNKQNFQNLSIMFEFILLQFKKKQKHTKAPKSKVYYIKFFLPIHNCFFFLLFLKSNICLIPLKI